MKIGDQTWMAENLRYETEEGSWDYGDNPINSRVFGRFYNWETACRVCPHGWHLPSDLEWQQLEIYLGMTLEDAEKEGFRGTDEGGKLKDTVMVYWKESNVGATNESGFTALPGGSSFSDGSYVGTGYFVAFWASDEWSNTDQRWSRFLSTFDTEIQKEREDLHHGLSVRCIKHQ